MPQELGGLRELDEDGEVISSNFGPAIWASRRDVVPDVEAFHLLQPFKDGADSEVDVFTQTQAESFMIRLAEAGFDAEAGERAALAGALASRTAL